MFNNLIESSSHTTELKRRGSFFLFTIATYAVLFVVAGVASIYAYDAHMDDPSTELVVMVNPMDFPQPDPQGPRPVTHASSVANQSSGYVRRNPQASVNESRIVPTTTSALPNTNPSLPPGARFTVGPTDSDPGNHGPGRIGTGGDGANSGGSVPPVDVGVPPTPPPVVKPVPKVISKGVITGEALSLPRPAYPPLAKQMHVQGVVSVQVLIDETGRVISAKAVNGNPALLHAAQRAALEARFRPTRLSDQPVKVSGVITYNFVLQN